MDDDGELKCHECPKDEDDNWNDDDDGVQIKSEEKN
jgi:hypothetical protein